MKRELNGCFGTSLGGDGVTRGKSLLQCSTNVLRGGLSFQDYRNAFPLVKSEGKCWLQPLLEVPRSMGLETIPPSSHLLIRHGDITSRLHRPSLSVLSIVFVTVFFSPSMLQQSQRALPSSLSKLSGSVSFSAIPTPPP